MVKTPVTIQTTSNQPGDPTRCAISPETIKMPDPIMDPATIIVESSKPSPRINPCVFVCATAAASAIRYSSIELNSETACFLNFFRERWNERHYTGLRRSVESLVAFDDDLR